MKQKLLFSCIVLFTFFRCTCVSAQEYSWSGHRDTMLSVTIDDIVENKIISPFDKQNHWFLTKSGLVELDMRTFKLQNLNNTFVFDSEHRREDEPFLKDTLHDLWFLTHKNKEILACQLYDKKILHSNIQENIRSMIVEKDTVWLGTFKKVILFEVKTKRFSSFSLGEDEWCAWLKKDSLNNIVINDQWFFERNTKKILPYFSKETPKSSNDFSAQNTHFKIEYTDESRRVKVTNLHDNAHFMSSSATIFEAKNYQLEDSCFWSYYDGKMFYLDFSTKKDTFYSENGILYWQDGVRNCVFDKDKIWLSGDKGTYVFDKKTKQYFEIFYPKPLQILNQNETHLLVNFFPKIALLNKAYLWKKQKPLVDRQAILDKVLLQFDRFSTNYYQYNGETLNHDFETVLTDFDTTLQKIIKAKIDVDYSSVYNNFAVLIHSDSLLGWSASQYVKSKDLDSIYVNTLYHHFLDDFLNQFDIKNAIRMNKAIYKYQENRYKDQTNETLPYLETIQRSLDSLMALQANEDALLQLKGDYFEQFKAKRMVYQDNTFFKKLYANFPNSSYYPMADWNLNGKCFYQGGRCSQDYARGSQECIDFDLAFLKKYPNFEKKDEVYKDLVLNYCHLSNDSTLQNYEKSLFFTKKLATEYPNSKVKFSEYYDSTSLKQQIEHLHWKVTVQANKTVFQEKEDIIFDLTFKRTPSDTVSYSFLGYPIYGENPNFKVQIYKNNDERNEYISEEKVFRKNLGINKENKPQKIVGNMPYKETIVLNKKANFGYFGIGFFSLPKGKYNVYFSIGNIASKAIVIEII